MSLRPGALIDGKYEIVARMASGGMGEVYRVRHLHLQQLRVVKILRADLAADSAAAQRFHQEARTAIQIKHPNVAILYDYSQLPDGRFYMVWEHIEGEDVGTWIRKRGPFDPQLAIELGIQSLRGLEAIHGVGVIHRDVAPDNLMITRDLRKRFTIKIIDLGLAKNVKTEGAMEITQAGSFLGKFQYCSPEQAGYRREEPDHRSDLYSLALVLYEMVCGLPPFDSESSHGHVMKRLSEQPLPLGNRSPGLAMPPGLADVVMQGLQRDREHRWQDAVSFIEALDGVRKVSDTSTQAIDAGEIKKTMSRPRKARRSTEVDVESLLSNATGSISAASRAPRPSPTPSRELTRTERLDLLAQIDRAAKKVEQSSKQFSQAERALAEGRFEEARGLIASMEAAAPRRKGLAELKQRLADSEGIARRRQQVVQAEQMLEKYLVERQQTLAQLALDTLLELYPNHPKRSDYEQWVQMIGQEVEQQQRADTRFEEAMSALARGDLYLARGAVDEIERDDLSGKLAGRLLAELQKAEQEREQEALVDGVRGRLETAIAEGEIERAQELLGQLAELPVTKVALATYRGRIDELVRRVEAERQAEAFEARYRDAVAAGDWRRARDVGFEMGKALPDHARPAEIFHEVSRLEGSAQKVEAIEQGLSAARSYLGAGRLNEAAMAIKVLGQMDPDNADLVELRTELDRIRRES